VGDVKINTTGVKHTFICESSPQSLAEGILHALRNTERTNGREVLLEKQLDSFAVAKNIIELYETVKKT